MLGAVAKLYNAAKKTVSINFNKKANCKVKILYMLLALFLFTIPLLIAVNIYCCLIKPQLKQKYFYHIMTHITN